MSDIYACALDNTPVKAHAIRMKVNVVETHPRGGAHTQMPWLHNKKLLSRYYLSSSWQVFGMLIVATHHATYQNILRNLLGVAALS